MSRAAALEAASPARAGDDELCVLGVPQQRFACPVPRHLPAHVEIGVLLEPPGQVFREVDFGLPGRWGGGAISGDQRRRESAQIVNEYLTGRPASSGRYRVFGKPAVMVQMVYQRRADECHEVGDEPAVAAPPNTLTAHHHRASLRRGVEESVDGVKKLGAAHVVGIGTKRVDPPPPIRRLRR